MTPTPEGAELASADISPDFLTESEPGRILRPGHNCWTIASSPSASVLIDGKAYFCALEKALRSAERSIVILGWDFDGRIRLCPDDGTEESLGQLLRSLVDSRPELHVHILVWSIAIAHAPGASLPLLMGSDWDNHPRIDLRLDTEHPIYAAHHQKVVTIDDAVAFAGGMDLTVSRWDTNDHDAEHPCRMTPDGESYGPVHDVQVMVNGEAARHLATLARERWWRATGEALPIIDQFDEMRWPTEATADFKGVDIAISRTIPAWRTEAAVEEISELNVDALRTARRSIYIEAQYLTCAEITKVLADLLQEPDGPEIVAVVACSSHGLMERLVMGANRDRLIRTLRQVDRYNRLRVMYPAIGDDDHRCEILVHAKVMIVDDRFLRVGSANLNNRSRGLDTECDLSIEATDAGMRQAISAVRNRLLAEHLGTDEATLTRCLDEDDSLIACIDRLNTGRRRLFAFDAMTCGDGPCDPIFGTALLDPARPLTA